MNLNLITERWNGNFWTAPVSAHTAPPHHIPIAAFSSFKERK